MQAHNNRMAARTKRTLASLTPIAPSRSLVVEIGQRIAADIATGRLTPGAQLPTEQAMMDAMGVSRTVIREAVATLRAEGLIATRQGIGSFVATLPTQALFRIEPGQAASLTDALHIMELRTAVETEAAGLAAERATKSQRRAIHAALDAIDAAIERGEPAVNEDFAFHAVITDATRNPQFRRFLDFLGRFIIPRASVRIRALNLRTYLMTFQEEHRAIVAAIDTGSVKQAQAAMRAHLISSSQRYRALAPDSIKDKTSIPGQQHA
ncbi:MAG: GntR family transcriptional regulator, transcriptional repressor for pyruvate dehydrogenase complex [Acetobacteraceae bacterium]|jgi:GntR family transcriptional repressor for pyruvate dehydrogenase complex|nr:GntR family transcriptional regulator, transcriptional repressor for pyruvate dehydrogenase complex [Acetobacteraceae bacterium]